MIRIFFEYVLPAIAPFLFYFGWVWLAARRAKETGGAAPDWRRGPWVGLSAAGLALLIAALVTTAWLGGEPAGGVYHAPALDKDGRIVPGHFERQKP